MLLFNHQHRYFRGKAFAPYLEGPWFDSRPSQTTDFKWVVEATLSNVRHIKGSSTKKLVDPYHTIVSVV